MKPGALLMAVGFLGLLVAGLQAAGALLSALDGEHLAACAHFATALILGYCASKALDDAERRVAEALDEPPVRCATPYRKGR